MSIRFTLFEEKDAVKVSEIIVSGLFEQQRKGCLQPDLKEIAKEYTPEEIVIQSAWKTILVARQEDEIIGTGAFAKIPRNNKNGEYWMLSVFVSKEQQGKTIGTQIVRQIEEKVMQLDAKCIRVPVRPEIKPFYKKLGYVEAKKRKEWDESDWCIMEKVF